MYFLSTDIVSRSNGVSNGHSHSHNQATSAGSATTNTSAIAQQRYSVHILSNSDMTLTMFIPSQQQQCWLEAVPDVLRAAGHLGRLLWLEPAGAHQLAAAQGAAAEGVLLPGRGVPLQVSCQHM